MVELLVSTCWYIGGTSWTISGTYWNIGGTSRTSDGIIGLLLELAGILVALWYMVELAGVLESLGVFIGGYIQDCFQEILGGGPKINYVMFLCCDITTGESRVKVLRL